MSELERTLFLITFGFFVVVPAGCQINRPWIKISGLTKCHSDHVRISGGWGVVTPKRGRDALKRKLGPAKYDPINVVIR